MKNWMLSGIVFIISFLILFLTDMPLWMFLLIAGPILAILAVFLTTTYSFRESLKPVSIPKSGFEKRIREMNTKMEEVNKLGFIIVDHFYLKTVPDSVIYIYRHEEHPFYLGIYHFGPKIGSDIITRYDNGYSLTTSDTVDSGMTPRDKKGLLQIFDKETYENQLINHYQAHTFLITNGLKLFDIPPNDFRHVFMGEFRKQAEYIKGTFFWPGAMIYRTIIKSGKVYCKSIKKQVEEGTVSLWGENIVLK